MSNAPFWDLTPIFPSLESSEFQVAFADALSQIESLEAIFKNDGVRRGAELHIGLFHHVIERWNRLGTLLETLDSFLYCLTSTDAQNDGAKARQSELEVASIRLQQLETQLVAWVGSGDVETLLENSELARQHEFWIRRAQDLAAHQMSETEENLAASLSPMGLGGWAKLHSQFTSLLTAKVEIEGETKTLPMSEIRALAMHPDRQTRQNAFESEICAWKKSEITLAAALNGVKGFQGELHARRGYGDDVAPTLGKNSIDAPTLAAMQGACEAAFPDFQRYLRAKAKFLGLEQLAWCDLFAPLGQSTKKWEWEEAREFLRQNFATYSPKLAEFSKRAFEEKWIDGPPRVGKQGGAYCIQILPGVSRILTNWNGSFEAVSTLAHELGHGYHNLCLQNRTPLQSQIPMTLAETASIFCETLIFESATQTATASEKIALLDAHLGGATQVVVDIHSRFVFEKSVFAKRKERELSPNEFCELMSAAQEQTYGDAVSPKHPWMWAVKGHYYGPTFYNYPYTFGLLLGLGLYAKYLEAPDQFREKYDDFLSRSGMADAQTLGREFGFDLTQSDFWEKSLHVLKRQINEFVELVG